MRARTILSILLAALAAGCGVNTRSVTPDKAVERVWKPSFVILVGLDRDAPTQAPAACRRLGVVEVESPNLKVSVSNELRKAARSIGGNTVASIKRTSPPRDRPVVYAGTVLHCPWFKVPTAAPSSRLAPSQHGVTSCTPNTLARFTPSVGVISSQYVSSRVRSLTLVPVGPMSSRSESAAKKG